jgi:hypothetical protein
MHSAAARLAAHFRQAMKAQSLSGRELATRVGRLRGSKYAPQNVSRRLVIDSNRPLIIIAPEARQYAHIMGLDLAELIRESIAAEDKCPTCGSPERCDPWNIDPDDTGNWVPCGREFHRNAHCVSVTDGETCGRPITFVAEGTDEISGWHHTNRVNDSKHWPIPPNLKR